MSDTVCVWNQDDYASDNWGTSCRNMFRIDDGPPSENKMKFCCFCGKPIEESKYEEPS